MGQVPKNIIYAEAGTKLTFNVNGKDVALDKEAVEAAGAQSFDELVKAGELTERDRPSFMKTVGNFSSQAQTGKYKLNTAGPSSLISMDYEGPTTNALMGKTETGEASERTAAGRFLSKRLKNDEASHMGRLNTILGTKIGAMALGEQEKTNKAEEATKVKADLQAKTAADAEITKYAGKPQQFAEYMNAKLGGGHNDAVVAAMSPDEKLRHAKEYFETVYPQVGKYEKSKGIDFSEIEKSKKPDGTYDYNSDFFTNFYGRLYEDEGRKQMQDYFGISPVQKEQETQDLLKKATEEADANAATANPNYHAVGENLVSKSPRINIGGLNYHAVLSKDPKTGKQSLEYVSLPENLASAKHDAMYTELKSAKRIQTTPGANGEILLRMDGKLYHIPKVGENIKARPSETFTGESPIKTDITQLVPSLKNFSLNPTNANIAKPTKKYTRTEDPVNKWLHSAIGMDKDGGVITLQAGGVFENNIQKRLAEEDAYEATLNKPETTTSPETSPAAQVIASTKGKTLPGVKGKGAPTIKDLYGAATDDNVELSEADKLDAGALASDFAGLVIGLTAGGIGGSAVSSGLGLASTIATAKADYLRDGTFGMDDLIKTGLSLTADAATLFPYLGEGAQSLKIVQHLPKVAKLLKYAGYAGLGAGALQLADKIQSGEKSITDLDTNDLKLIIGGLRMASAGTSMGKTVKSQPVEEFEGRVINPAGQEVPATFKRVGDSFVTADEALKDMKPVMEKTKFGLGKPRIAGSAASEVKVTPEETESSSFLGRKAMERRNTMRTGLNKEDKAKEIESLMQTQKAKDLEAMTTRKAKSAEGEALKKEPPKTPIPTIIRSNKRVPPVDKTPITPAPTRENILQDISKQPLSPKVQQILDRVSVPVPTTSSVNKPTVKVPRVSPGSKKEWEAAKQSEKETVKMHKAERKGIKNKTIAPRHQDSTLASINRKYHKGGILYAQAGTTLGMQYDPESDYITPGTGKSNFIMNTLIPKLAGFSIKQPLNTKTPDTLLESTARTRRATANGGFPTLMQQRLTPQPIVSHPVIPTKSSALVQPSSGGLGNLKVNLNNKSAIQAAEAMRVLLLNKKIGQRDTRVEAPLVSAPAEVAMPVRGDMLTEAAFEQQANQIRGSYRPTSDATRNLAERSSLEQQAGQRMAQGVAADAQARQTSQGRSIENLLRNNELRSRTTGQNTESLARAVQGQRQAEIAKGEEQTANTDTLLASQITDKKSEMQQKEGIIKKMKMDQLQRTLDMSPEFRGLQQQYYQESLKGQVSPETQARYDRYQQALDRGTSQVYGLPTFKTGGSTDEVAKYEMDMYKERKKDNKEVNQISNKWKEKVSDKKQDISVKVSKELTDFIAKILK